MLINPDVNHVLVNGRVWYRTYIPDVGERWTRYMGRQYKDVTEDSLLKMGEVYELHLNLVPLNPRIDEG